MTVNEIATRLISMRYVVTVVSGSLERYRTLTDPRGFKPTTGFETVGTKFGGLWVRNRDVRTGP